MSAPILSLNAITKTFGDAVALAPLDLAVTKGEFIALMGPSGCGKSTTLRMLAGLEAPTSGAIKLWERDITDLPPWERHMPMVWQSYALFPFMTVRQNVEFGLKEQRKFTAPDRRKKAEEWMARLEIEAFADRPVQKLSGGQRQRVALARALALEPEILLLDEPLSALDAHLRLQMQGELRRLHAELGITFVYVTHSQSEAFSMADRVAILSEGKLQQIANRFVAEFVGASTILTGTAKGDGLIETPVGTFHATGGHPPSAGASATFLVPSNLVELSASKSGAANEVHAELLTEEFTGAFVTLHLKLADGSLMKVQTQQSDLDRLGLNVGAHIYASWAADAAYILEGD